MNNNELKLLANRAFNIIEILEVSELKQTAFTVVRKKLLDLGNDILRLEECAKKEGDE